MDVQVLVEGRLAKRLSARDSNGWEDWRVDLFPVSDEARCVLVFDSDADFHAAPCEVVYPEEQEATGILLLLVDALRQDRVGCYGCERPTSPSIDALSHEAVRFTQLVPQSSWTRPSVASLLTSTYPSVHGAEDRPDMVRAGLPTLAQALNRNGYETHVIMGNACCLPVWGIGGEFSRGCDIATSGWEAAGEQDTRITDEAIRVVRSVAGRKWLLYVHLMSPHLPYMPPAPYDAMWRTDYSGLTQIEALAQCVRDTYDGEITFVDSSVGRLFEEVRRLGLWDSSVIVFVSDHGEQFWEHGVNGHGYSLHEEEIRVPFLMKLPQSRHGGEVFDSIVEMVDVAPTVLEAVGVSPDPRFQGKSFLKDVEQGPSSDASRLQRVGYASLRFNRKHERMAKTTTLKYIHQDPSSSDLWYDLVHDAGEKHPLKDAPTASPALAEHAARITAQGAWGLHLMVTEARSASRTITGRIVGKSLGEATLRHPSNGGDIERAEGELRFRVAMQEPVFLGAVLWTPHAAARNCANLLVKVAPDDVVGIDVQADGTTVAADRVRFGAAAEHRELSGRPFRVEDALAAADAFDPGRLPEDFVVYVWYVKEPGRIGDEALSPEMREALQGLGYLK